MDASRRRRSIGPSLLVVLIGVMTACSETANDLSTTTTQVSTTTTPSSVGPVSWPSSTRGFDTPTAAARHFIARVLGVNPRTSSFRATDPTHGTIDVYIGERLPSVPDVARATLALVRVDSRGWFVADATSTHNFITIPTKAARVEPGLLRIAGLARGFEGQVAVSVFAPDSVDSTGAPRVIAHTSTIAGSMDLPRPFEVTVDISSAGSGDPLVILVRGGRGLEQDPGEFAMIPVVVDGS